jgi:hypothetical protein
MKPMRIPLKSSKRNPTPEFLRLPAPKERCKFTGLSRTSLLELCAPCKANDRKPPVRSHVLKKRHAQRGVRLIDYKSLIAYVRSQGDST